MNSLSDSKYLEIVQKGIYYYPATKPYSEFDNPVVRCDRCNKNYLESCIHYENYDLCLICAHTITSIHKSTYKSPKPHKPHKINYSVTYSGKVLTRMDVHSNSNSDKDTNSSYTGELLTMMNVHSNTNSSQDTIYTPEVLTMMNVNSNSTNNHDKLYTINSDMFNNIYSELKNLAPHVTDTMRENILVDKFGLDNWLTFLTLIANHWNNIDVDIVYYLKQMFKPAFDTGFEDYDIDTDVYDFTKRIKDHPDAILLRPFYDGDVDAKRSFRSTDLIFGFVLISSDIELGEIHIDESTGLFRFEPNQLVFSQEELSFMCVDMY